MNVPEGDYCTTHIARRVFLRIASGFVTCSALAGGGAEVASLLRDRIQEEHAEAFNLLRRLIGQTGDHISIGTVPAINHPNVRKLKTFFSQSGREVSASYVNALSTSNCLVTETGGAICLRKQDTAVVIGSRLANTFAEHYLGHANRPPDKSYTFQDKNGARACLRWTFYSDSSVPPVEVVQWGKSWLSHNNLIVQDDGQTYSVPEQMDRNSGKKHRENDYLLLHVLPRHGVNDPQRTVIFEGLHRNGTRAAGLLCSKPPLDDLRSIANTIGGVPYYQALFKVNTQVNPDGEAHPRSIELCADPFPLRFST